jgi:two-component system nitrogen regulation response regulator GlnG
VTNCVLIADDEPSWVALLTPALRRACVLTEAASPDEVRAAVRQGFDGVVLLGAGLAERGGPDFAAQLQRMDADVQLVVLRDDGRPWDERGVRGVTRGDGVAAVAGAVFEALAERARRASQGVVTDPRRRFGAILTRSERMRRVFDALGQVVDSRVTVLLQGESGTGKELVARALHQAGSRAEMPFVAINCAGIPDALLESELFGHERGAFTGAVSAKKGKFEQADGGTLFLDEIGEMPLHLQAKLLRVLQDRQIERVGSSAPRSVDVRIISATHRDLTAMVQARAFREDLFYRLAVFPVTLPPLRERGGDVALLARHFTARCCAEEGRALMGIAPETLALLERHPFPGNVRELENIISRAVLVALSDQILPEDLPEDLLARTLTGVVGGSSSVGPLRAPGSLEVPPPAAVAEPVAADSSREVSLAQALARLYPTLSSLPGLEVVEELLMTHALALAGGNIMRAAEALGVSRATLYRRLRATSPGARAGALPDEPEP